MELQENVGKSMLWHGTNSSKDKKEYDSLKQQLSDIKYDINYAMDNGNSANQSQEELRDLQNYISKRAKQNPLLIDLIESVENTEICESVGEQYLYHAMWKTQFEYCKKQNRLVPHNAGENLNGHLRQYEGVSMSRSLDVCVKLMERNIQEYKDEWKENPDLSMSIHLGDDIQYITPKTDLTYVVLVFDRNKLKQKHKIIPYQFLRGEMRDVFGDEQEEVVVGDIPNFMNYVVDVIEYKSTFENINEDSLGLDSEEMNTWNNFVAKIGKRYLFDNYLYWKKHGTAVKITDIGSVYITRPNDIKRRAFSQAKTFDDIYNTLKQHKLLPENLNETFEKELSESIIAYHGSPNVFKNFDKAQVGTSTKKFEDGDYTSTDYGFFFTDDKKYASGYGDNIYKCAIQLNNPLVVDMSEYIATEENLAKFLQQAKDENKDGVIFKNIREVGRNPTTEYVVFNSDNIKIVDNIEEAVAYHGSQNDNLTPDFARGFYLTNNKDMATDFAKGYLFNYELADNETPTLYTYEVSFANPYIVKSEEEYEAHFTDRDVSEIITPLKQAGYDGIIIPEFETGCKYYVIFDNTKSVKLIKKESATLDESALDLDPEELSKNREEDRELEKLSFQRPNKPMSKELRELLYGKKPNIQKSTTQKTTQKVSSKNKEDDVFTDPVVRSYSSYYDDEYNKFQKQLADIKFDIAYAEEHGDNPQQSKAELRNLEQKIYNRARYNLLLLDLLENKVCNSSKLNEDFYRWFQDSKVITETYEPKMVSLSENPKKVYGKGIYFDKENDGSVKAYLQISNPFRLNEEYSISTFRPYIENIDILCNKQKISGKELFSLLIEAKYGIQLDKMIDTTTMLQNLGFDGIETKNKWIVFSKKQIQKI